MFRQLQRGARRGTLVVICGRSASSAFENFRWANGGITTGAPNRRLYEAGAVLAMPVFENEQFPRSIDPGHGARGSVVSSFSCGTLPPVSAPYAASGGQAFPGPQATFSDRFLGSCRQSSAIGKGLVH